MRILILGGNGYLGSKVVKCVLSEGHEIVCTKRPTSDLTRLEDVADQIRFIPAAIEGVEAAMQYTSFDLFLNMACNYGRSEVLYDNVIEANIEFPLKVLNMVVENGTKRVITIGTGLPDNLNMYSFSKKMFSDFGRFYADKHGIDFLNMKLQMFYGADEPRDRFLPNLIYKMLKGEEVDVTLGTQRRDIISADDIVKAILTVINSDLHGYKGITVGTGIAPSISEIVDFIWEETEKKSKVNKGAVPMRKNEPDCVATLNTLRSICDWRPIFWQDGLRQMINYIRQKG